MSEKFSMKPGAVNRVDAPGLVLPPPPVRPYIKAPKRLLSEMSSEERKTYPLVKGFVDYFPDAIAAVAHVSFVANQKHNPGQPLHWARGKSMDHADCQLRHMIERDTVDGDKLEHMACKAWRAMAELQQFLEEKYALDLPRAATAPGVELAKS